jgi:capsular exopolysaccharide synthesis family protein
MSNKLIVKRQGSGEVARPGSLPEPEEVWVPDAAPSFFQDLLRILAKRRKLAIGAFLGFLLAAIGLAAMAPTTFTASTTLMIAPPSAKMIGLTPMFAQATDSYYETQYGILRSRSLARRVLDAEGGDQTPAPPGGLKAFIKGFLPAAPPSPEELEARRVTGYLASLDIKPTRDTHLVRIEFTSKTPERAARMANAHARAYVQHSLMIRRSAGEEARALLEETLVGLRDQLEEARQALNAFQRDHGIVSLDDEEDLIVRRVADLQARLTATQAETAALRAQFLTTQGRDPETVPAVLASNSVAGLKQDLSRLQAQRDQLAARYVNDGSPDVLELDAQIAAARRRLRVEVQKVVSGIESGYMANLAKEESLREALDQAQRDALNLNETTFEYSTLLAEVETNRQLYENARAEVRQTDVAQGLPAGSVYILDAALPPISPDGLNLVQTGVVSLLLALLGGVGVAFLVELLDGRIRTTEELSQLLGLPNLGSVPELEKAPRASETKGILSRLSPGRGRGQPAAARTDTPRENEEIAELSEAYRRIRMNLLLSRAEGPPRMIVFTSTAAGEGKTTTTLNVAAALAQLGDAVLVIEADLRKPTACRVLGLAERGGLTEALTGGFLESDLIETDAGFQLLSAGKIPPNPAELLSSRRMSEILEESLTHFDYVLIDSPPLTPVTDAMLLGRMADGVVLVVDQKTTPRASLKRVCDQLAYARVHVLGTVLNRAAVESTEYYYAYGWRDAPS